VHTTEELRLLRDIAAAQRAISVASARVLTPGFLLGPNGIA
jgi:hypothetical protein